MSVTNVSEAAKNRMKETGRPDGSAVREEHSNPAGTASAVLHKGEEVAKMMAHETCEAASAARGAIGSAAISVTHGLEASGRYLGTHSPQQMADDLTGFIRHYPVSSVLVGFGLGCAVGVMWTWSARPEASESGHSHS